MNTLDIVKIEEFKPGEKFSIIEIYPYLHYNDLGNEETESDLSRIFQESLDPQVCSFNIHVRSKEALRELSSWLIGSGFEEIITNTGNFNLLFESLIGEEKENRQYYDKNSDVDKILVGPGKCNVTVVFEIDRLVDFKNCIKKFCKKFAYKNKWLETEGHYIYK